MSEPLDLSQMYGASIPQSEQVVSSEKNALKREPAFCVPYREMTAVAMRLASAFHVAHRTRSRTGWYLRFVDIRFLTDNIAGILSEYYSEAGVARLKEEILLYVGPAYAKMTQRGTGWYIPEDSFDDFIWWVANHALTRVWESKTFQEKNQNKEPHYGKNADYVQHSAVTSLAFVVTAVVRRDFSTQQNFALVLRR